MRAPRLPRGITKHGTGWRIRLGPGGAYFRKRFPASTSLEDVEKALHEARSKHRAGKRSASSGTLAVDVAAYLRDYFTGRAGKAERERHLTLWTELLGADTLRATVTREDVSRVLHQWRATFSADTCNKRRAALLAFYNTLNGKGGQNPVRDVPKFRVSAPLPRGLDYRLIEKAFRKLRKTKSRARLKVMAYTGARPVQLRAIAPDDWDDKHHTLLLRATGKGAGTKPHVVLLSGRAQLAMREFEDTEAWGKFASAPIGRVWKAAAIAAGLPADVRVYDLRHSFGSEVYRTTGDLRITKELMGHSSFAMTERYTMAAVPERQRVAIAALDVAAAARKKRRRRA